MAPRLSTANTAQPISERMPTHHGWPYPTFRIVSMRSSPIFRRSRLTYTSTTFVPGSCAYPQTDSQYLLACADLTLVPHQVLEQEELSRRQMDDSSVARRLAPLNVEGQRALAEEPARVVRVPESKAARVRATSSSRANGFER